MLSYSRKVAAVFVLFSIIFFTGYCFAESAGAVYDAHEHSTRSCEHAVSSLGRAVNMEDRASDGMALSHHIKNRNIKDSLFVAFATRLPGFKTGPSGPGMTGFRIPLSRPTCVLRSLRL